MLSEVKIKYIGIAEGLPSDYLKQNIDSLTRNAGMNRKIEYDKESKKYFPLNKIEKD